MFDDYSNTEMLELNYGNPIELSAELLKEWEETPLPEVSPYSVSSPFSSDRSSETPSSPSSQSEFESYKFKNRPFNFIPPHLRKHPLTETELIEQEFSNLYCCGKVHPTYHDALAHHAEFHSGPLPLQSKECSKPSDLFDARFSIVERARYFLMKNPRFLEHSFKYRPYPHILDPEKIPHTYLSAVALAHDYMTALKAQPVLYERYISYLMGHSYPSTQEVICLELAPILYHLGYVIPFTMYTPPYVTRARPAASEEKSKEEAIESRKGSRKQKVKGAPKVPKAPKESRKPKRKVLPEEESESDNKPRKAKRTEYRCERPGCDKVYKQWSGLKYHLQTSKCVGYTGIVKGKDNQCPYPPCRHSFGSSGGLKYHLERYHIAAQNGEAPKKKSRESTVSSPKSE